MGLEQRLQRRVRASKFADDDEDGPFSEQEDPQQMSKLDEEASSLVDDMENPDATDDADGEEPRHSDAEDDEPATHGSTFADISFGALASAQASLGTSLKRKRTSTQSTATHDRHSRPPSPFREAEERRAGQKISQSMQRTSKHAPTEVSSKKAVSRKRSVVDIPTKPQARDPRFLSLSGPVNENVLRGNYAFLDDYRASEISDLRSKAKQEKDVGRKEALKKQLRAMEDRDRAKQKVEEERRVVREHRKQEREAVKQGKKPYFLKQGEVKKQVLQKKFEGLSEKKVERVMERRRKKMASKERKNMPDARRSEM